MKIFRTITEVKNYLRPLQKAGKSIGLSPTMGYLHQGHLSLVEASVKDNDISVISIFVNPTQFGANEDLDDYPRDEVRDFALAEKAGADVIFIPSVEEMYQNAVTTVHVSELTKGLCAISRPTHFNGVTTVVTKLFNIVRPDRAYFGQKDAQQGIVITKMAKDLDMDVEVIICPIVREEDGLAMSSRNVYLTHSERPEATMLRKSLLSAKEKFEKGETNTQNLRNHIINMINQTSGKVDYVEVVDVATLQPIEVIKKEALIAMAVQFTKSRLLDNIFIG